VLFCQRIEDPSAFGVVVTNDAGTIVDYVEKPQEWVGDLAMIGIYAFKDGARLNRELQHLIDNNVVKGGEYQLPDALRNMTRDGLKFIPGEVSEWMDCGNKAVTVETNSRILGILEEERRLDPVPASATVVDSVILPPCHIGEGVVIERSVIGPHVTLGAGTVVTDSRVSNALVAGDSHIEHAVLDGAMIGAHASWHGTPDDASIGDYCTVGNPQG
jgi:glucose-1-phosphate thymidylyltransferase